MNITGTEIAQIITAIGVVITAISSYRNGRKISKVEEATNGMKAQLEAAAREEGRLAGIAEEKTHHG